MAQEGVISMNPDALLDKRVRQYLLDNDMSPAEYDRAVDALAKTGEGRD